MKPKEEVWAGQWEVQVAPGTWDWCLKAGGQTCGVEPFTCGLHANSGGQCQNRTERQDTWFVCGKSENWMVLEKTPHFRWQEENSRQSHKQRHLGEDMRGRPKMGGASDVQ